MILYENNPIITDIFIRNQDREILQKQIEAEALRKLKHPSRSKQLKSFLES